MLFGSCKDDDKGDTGKTGHNPNLPVVIESFIPDEGKLREKVIIKSLPSDKN